MTTPRAVPIVLLLAGCGLGSGGRGDAPAAPAAADLAYDVTLADDLARLDVTVRFAAAPPSTLYLGDARGFASITGFAVQTDGVSTPLAAGERSLSLPPLPAGAALSYRVDLARLADTGGLTRVGRSFISSPGRWLVRPWFDDGEGAAVLRFRLPEGVRASVPWTRRADGAYDLGPSTFRWRGAVAFGALREHEVRAADASLRVAVLDRPLAVTAAGLERWLGAAARAQASLWGAFPVAEAQIVVRPVSSNEAVPFGETQRGGGAAVVLRVGDEAQDAAFADDWVAVHEFAHLGMPAIPEADSWLSEGFIQYYTEVLMGRAGLLDERRAWEEIAAGFARGRRDDRGGTLAEASTDMVRTHRFMRVYWGGAAMALLLDVELRRSSGGKVSLDDAMREIRRAFTARAVEATGDEILTHLDRWLGRPLFTGTARPLLASRAFPDVAATLARLGVNVTSEAGDLGPFDDAAPDAPIRRAILAR